MCSNGCRWSDEAQEVIDQAGFPAEQVTWIYVNHDEIVRLMQAVKQVDDTLRLSGKAIVEDFDYRRVLVGKIAVSEIAQLFTRHGDLLLDRNIRRYLGLQGNRVNSAISDTLNNQSERPNFYFYNNGVTLLCKKFSYNALQGSDYQVQAEGLQVINGGQTCKTIQKAIADLAGDALVDIEKAFVLVRMYELPEDCEELVRSITYATNSQSPVDLRDLRSNDAKQKALETDIAALKNAADEAFGYLRNRNDQTSNRRQIKSTRAAEAVLAVWRQSPHQAKAQSRDLFSKSLYEKIFTDQLNGAQTVMATLLFRFAEKKRQRTEDGNPDWLVYASYFTAMLMGKYLLDELSIKRFDLHDPTSAISSDLDNSQIAELLKLKFGSSEPKLKANASVRVLTSGKKWLADDSSTSFMIEKQDSVLNVYQAFTLRQLNHLTFPNALRTWELNDEKYHQRALIDIEQALQSEYVEHPLPLQKLAGIFRRGEILEKLCK